VGTVDRECLRRPSPCLGGAVGNTTTCLSHVRPHMQTSRRVAIALLAAAVSPTLSFAEGMRRSEQEVLAAFLNKLSSDVGPTQRTLVFVPRTSIISEAIIGSEPPAQQLRAELPDATDAVIADFLRVLAKSASLELPRRLVRREMQWTIANETTLNRVFDLNPLNEAWKAFYKEFPSAAGLTRVSRVGLDEKSQQALFYLSFTPAGLGGTGHFILMQRRFGIWRELASKQAWIS